MSDKKVILLVGLPGSGKSYYTKEFIKKHPTDTVEICSADHYFETPEGYKWNPSKLKYAHEACYDKFEHAMKKGIDIIFIDNTNIIKPHRDKYVSQALLSGYRVFLKVFKPDVDLSATRNIHNVPKETLYKMAGQLDIAPGEYEVLAVNGTPNPTLIEATQLQKLVKGFINEYYTQRS